MGRRRFIVVLFIAQVFLVVVYVNIGSSNHEALLSLDKGDAGRVPIRDRAALMARPLAGAKELAPHGDKDGLMMNRGPIQHPTRAGAMGINDYKNVQQDEDVQWDGNVQRGDENVQRAENVQRDENIQLFENVQHSDDNVQYVDTRWRRRLLFIWCGNRSMLFSHFLSIRSAVRSIYPSSVMFAYEHYPVVIHQLLHSYAVMYDRWILDVEDTVPFLIKQNITSKDNLCNNDNRNTMDIERFLAKHDFLGCLYVADLTVLVEPFVLEDVSTKVDYYDVSSRQGFLFVPETKENSKTGRCLLVDADIETVPEMCFVLEKPTSVKFQLDPEDIMTNSSALASQLRLIYYGSREYLEQKPDSRTSAPNIAHYVWLGGGKMNFCFFMSVLSTILIGKVDTVFVHGDSPPAGQFWQQLMGMDNISHRIEYVPWDRPKTIFGSLVEQTPNQADVVKSSVMWTMGGILMDPDILFVRAPDPEMFHYEAYLMAGGHPHMLNQASAISKPRSEYARLWMESEKNFKNNAYVWNCCYNTYKTWERNPRIAKVVRDFTLICKDGHCHGMWKHKEAIFKKVNLTDSDNWQKRVVNVHFPEPDPYKKFESGEKCLQMQDIAGEMCRLVLRAAGLMGQTEGLVP